MEDIIYAVIGYGMMVLPLVLVILDFVFFAIKKEVWLFELIAFFTGSVYMMFAYVFWDLPEYSEPLNIYGLANAHEPFSGKHLLTIAACMLWGFFSYLILKFNRKTMPPLVEALSLAGVYIGVLVNIVWCVQLLCGARPIGVTLRSWDWLIIICLCIVPVFYLLHVIQLMWRLIRERAEKQAGISYQNLFLQKINCWLLKGANLFWVTGILVLPVLGILILLLCLFGQQPDSVVKAFTETSDWILSGKISPPPVEYDAHYLCTVSLRGHQKLVKPIRYGVRKGSRIVVNRQLCIANAFEQLIMEKTPRLHRRIRHFYDTYGYPVSKHIKTAWSADVIYLLMKPLEWIFLLVLYLFDAKPEDRIARQYLPEIHKN